MASVVPAHDAKRDERSARRRDATLIAIGAAALILAAVAIGLLVVGRDSPAVGMLSITFVAIVLEALPFVALGALIGGLVEVFVSQERITAWLPRQKLSAVFMAGALGLIIPVCECAIIPVTRRLVRKGVPFSVALAYLLAGPIVNPLVAGSTYVAYAGDTGVVFIRLLFGFCVAVFTALWIDELFPGTKALRPDALGELQAGSPAHDHACGCGEAHEPDAAAGERPSLLRRLVHAGGHAADDFVQVGAFLVAGAFIAALSQTLVASETYVALADTPAAAIGVMMGLAVLLNLCSEADAFVAASYRGVLPIAAQVGFMVLGPMLDLKLIAMYLSFVRKRALLVLATTLCVLIFLLSLVLHYNLERGAG